MENKTKSKFVEISLIFSSLLYWKLWNRTRSALFFFMNGWNNVLNTSADNRILWPTDCFQNSVVQSWWWAQQWTRSPLKCNEYTNHTSWWSSISQAIKLTPTNTIGSESLKHTKKFEISWWRRIQRRWWRGGRRQWQRQRRREKEKWTKAGTVLCAPERGEMKMKITTLTINFGICCRLLIGFGGTGKNASH